MTLKPIVSILATVVALSPVALWAQDAERTPKPPKAAKLVTAEGGRTVMERQFFGQVAAKETVDLAFQVGGQVFKLPVNEGQLIPEGALIAELDLERFNLQLEQAQLRKQQADRTKARNQKLAGTVSQVTIDDANTEAKLADVALRNAQTDLEHATLHAPFNAMIARRETALFSTVAAGAPSARIHDMSELRIEIDVPEVLFQRSSEDDQLTLTARFPGGANEYPVEVLEYTAEASSVGQTYRVTLKMDPPKDRQILPGASTTVKVMVDTGLKHITLPATAIVPSAAGDAGVMVFAPTGADLGIVSWTAVEIEPNQFGNYHVISGLEAGQEVVATGGAAMTHGETVRRFTGFTN